MKYELFRSVCISEKIMGRRFVGLAAWWEDAAFYARNSGLGDKTATLDQPNQLA